MSTASEDQRDQAQSLIGYALNNSTDPHRYKTRLQTYPLVREMGCLPSDTSGILRDGGASLFHSLAFRMATYENEGLFKRLEELLSIASEAIGWDDEYSNWSSESDHWAVKWDKFNQFLWLLQCFEYYADLGGKVAFPYSEKTAKPDIFVEYPDGSNHYVECFYYTKWWGTEQLVEGLLYALDKDLRIERTSNIEIVNAENPLSGTENGTLIPTLAELSKHLKPEQFEVLREQASIQYPVEVCQLGPFQIVLEGSGEYQPQDNAQGDPRNSWQVFSREILDKKKDKNGLANHRSNLLLVNCLGLDFQLALDEHAHISEVPGSIDQVWICACGVTGKLQSSRRLMAYSTSI